MWKSRTVCSKSGVQPVLDLVLAKEASDKLWKLEGWCVCVCVGGGRKPKRGSWDGRELRWEAEVYRLCVVRDAGPEQQTALYRMGAAGVEMGR